jgi:hypothetical protein
MTLNFGNQLFPPRGEFIASFNFQDVLQNNSYLIFHAGKSTNVDGNLINVLFSAVFDSNSTVTKAAFSTTGSSEKIIDDDFDIVIDNTINLKGKVIVEITSSRKEITGNIINTFYVVKLRKWDGSTETEIASAKTSTFPTTTSSEATARHSLSMDISTKTKLIKGDTIRVTIEVWATNEDDLTGEVGYYHDPTSRTQVGGEDVDFKIFLPVVVQT